MQAKAAFLAWGAVTLVAVGLAWDLARGPTTIADMDVAAAKRDERKKKISEARESNSALRKITKRWRALGRRGEYVKLTKTYRQERS